MFKRIIILMVIGLVIYSFSYFSQHSERTVYRTAVICDAYDGEAVINNTKISNLQFSNLQMNFEGEKVIGDVFIGPEIPITGLTGFYDYHFNGSQPHYLIRLSSTVMHACYMTALDSLDPSTSRRVKYAFSTDNGTTWADLGTVPTIRAGFPSLNSKSTGEATVASHYVDAGGQLSAFLDYDISPGIGVFTEVQAPSNYIWPLQTRVTNGNILVLGTTYRGASPTDTTTLAVFNSTTNTFGPRHDFFHTGTANDNSSLAMAGGPSGRAIVVINAYRESGGNFGGSRIFSSTSNDNGQTWATPSVLYNPQIIMGDTATPYVNGATDVIYDNAGNTYTAFNTLGLTGFFSEARLYVMKNNETPTLVAGGPTSPVHPIAGAITTVANQQNFNGSLDHPCLSISEDQQYIFVSFSVLFQADTLNGWNKAHVFYSWAPLATLQWNAPVQVTASGPNSFDERYASIASVTPLEGGYYSVYMSYQKDTQPGSHVVNTAPPSRSWMIFRRIDDATLISVKNNQQIADEYRLFQNYPNPFNPSTKIGYNLLKNSFVTLKIYDILGKEMKTIVSGNQSSGYREVELDAQGFSSGIYFYTIEAVEQGTENLFKDTKKMILIK